MHTTRIAPRPDSHTLAFSMTCRMAATTAACLLLVCAPRLAAQRTPASAASTELGVTGGVGQSMRRDLSASPLAFSGHGSDVAIALRRVTGPSAIELTLNGGLHSLRSSSSASRATERVGQGQLSVALLRTLGDHGECACGIAIGAALSGNMMLTRHAYDDPTHRSADFLFGAVGVGPAASWRAPVAGGFCAEYTAFRDDNVGLYLLGAAARRAHLAVSR